MLQSVILREEQRRKGEKRKQEQHGETKPDENLFSPKVIFFKFGATLQKHYIKLHSYRAVTRKGFITLRV